MGIQECNQGDTNGMRLARSGFLGVVWFAAMCGLCGPETARGDLQWHSPKKEFVRLRLVALAWNHPRSSFFGNEEVFIAEKELTKDESQLVKLVYNFLPYQPRLSDEGLNYFTIHELRAFKDPECDETVAHLLTAEVGDWRGPQSQLHYATDAPVLNLARRKSRLPCYVTSADDYAKPLDESPIEPVK
jgi:hypothetical protein